MPSDDEPEKSIFLDSPHKFLLDSGLLFEINRRVLHPFGLALSLKGEGEDLTVHVWDGSSDPQGLVVEPAAFTAGLGKFEQFKKTQRERLAARLMALGYIVQGTGEQ